MSRLFCTERGRIFHTHAEELTRWRLVRKDLDLPAAAADAPAEIWMYLSCYEGNEAPLRVEVNGKAAGRLEPCDGTRQHWTWRRVAVPRGRLKRGVNQIVLRCESPAMTAWMLGVEGAHRDPRSFLSFDDGETWRNDALGAHGMFRGEYLVRLLAWSDKLRPQPLPEIVYENPKHPRVRAAAKMVPEAIRAVRDPWQQTLALRTFVCTRWQWSCTGSPYTPWDPWTVLEWTKREWCHGNRGRIAFCVHFGSLFTALAGALGHKARNIITTGDFNSGPGHFMSEVYDPRRGKWVLHDPNLDTHYERHGAPMSAVEIADWAATGKSLADMSRSGPGFATQPEKVRDGFARFFASGKTFVHTGAWTRNDYVSDPTAAPPNHGATSYTETDAIWYEPAGAAPSPMFPFRTGEPAVLAKAPG